MWVPPPASGTTVGTHNRPDLGAAAAQRGAPAGVQSGGSARGYQELFAPLTIPATAEQACGQAVHFCSAALGATAR